MSKREIAGGLKHNIEDLLDALVKNLNKNSILSEEDLKQFEETPERYLRWLFEFFQPVDLETELEETLKVFAIGHGERLIVETDIVAYSICPHHLLPVKYTVAIGYTCNGKVLGASKLARLIDLFASMPLLQEVFTERIVKALMDSKVATGAGVYVEGEHLCMQMRGVKKAGKLVTMEFGGKLGEENWKNEFLRFVGK